MIDQTLYTLSNILEFVLLDKLLLKMTTIPSMVVSAPTLGSGNLKDVVRLPMGENINEWMAVNSKP